VLRERSQRVAVAVSFLLLFLLMLLVTESVGSAETEERREGVRERVEAEKEGRPCVREMSLLL
jgi:hypothetical protein